MVIMKTAAHQIISFNLTYSNILEECDGSVFRVEGGRLGM
jgi:hypothetical protein